MATTYQPRSAPGIQGVGTLTWVAAIGGALALGSLVAVVVLTAPQEDLVLKRNYLAARRRRYVH